MDGVYAKYHTNLLLFWAIAAFREKLEQAKSCVELLIDDIIFFQGSAVLSWMGISDMIHQVYVSGISDQPFSPQWYSQRFGPDSFLLGK